MPEVVHADGAYNSPENQSFCDSSGINLTLHAIQGKASDYKLVISESGEVSVFHIETKQDVNTVKIKRKDGSLKWRIKTLSQKYRYFTQKDINGQLLREKMANTLKVSLFSLTLSLTLIAKSFAHPIPERYLCRVIKLKTSTNQFMNTKNNYEYDCIVSSLPIFFKKHRW